MTIENKFKIQELVAKFANSFDVKDWKISGITQKVLWNEGTSSLHKGAKG